MTSQDIFFLSILLLLPLVASVYDLSNGGGQKGPSHDDWGGTCSHGKLQSPINIITNQTVLAKSSYPILTIYRSVFAYLVDDGYNNIGVRYNSKHAEVKINGKIYTMKLMHWHSPSEHRINERQFPLELHIVHEAPDHSRAVVSILYKYGAPDRFIDQLNMKLAKMHKMVVEGSGSPQVSLGMLNTKFLGNITEKYYRYMGSLTSPPCTEPVIWTLLFKLRNVSRKQVLTIRSPSSTNRFMHNWRSIQPLNGRTVKAYI